MSPSSSASVTSLLHGFLGVVVSRRAWLRVLWLALAFPLGLATFVFLVTGLSLGVGLSVLVVGPPLLVLVLLAARALAVAEQRMARTLLGAEVEPAAWLVPGRRPGAWSRLGANLRDGFTWRGLAFLALRLPIGIVAFAALVTLAATTAAFLAVPFGELGAHLQLGPWTPSRPGEIALAFAAGIVLVPIALHGLNGMGWLAARLAAWMMKPGRPAQDPATAA